MDGGFLDVDVDVVVVMVDFRSRRASSILARRSAIRSIFCSLLCQTTAINPNQATIAYY